MPQRPATAPAVQMSDAGEGPSPPVVAVSALAPPGVGWPLPDLGPTAEPGEGWGQSAASLTPRGLASAPGPAALCHQQLWVWVKEGLQLLWHLRN